MKRVSLALMAFAALLMASCHDEPVTPIPNGEENTENTVVNPVPLNEYLTGTWFLDTSVLATNWDINQYDLEYGYSYPYHEEMVFSDSDVYLSFPDTTATYSIIDYMTINIPLYGGENTQILQLGNDSMLVKGYIPERQFNYTALAWTDFIYLFHRQH